MDAESTTALPMGMKCPSTILGIDMNENAVHLKDLMKGGGLTRKGTAALLYVQVDTLHKWLKPSTTAHRIPCPRWAVELLAYKTHQKIPAMSAGGGLEEAQPAAEAPPPEKPVAKSRRKAGPAEAAAKVLKPAKPVGKAPRRQIKGRAQ